MKFVVPATVAQPPATSSSGAAAPPSGAPRSRPSAASPASPPSLGPPVSHVEPRPHTRPIAQSSSLPQPHTPFENRQRCPASAASHITRPGEHSTHRFETVLRGSSSQVFGAAHSESARHWMQLGGARARSQWTSGATHSRSELHGGAAQTPGAVLDRAGLTLRACVLAPLGRARLTVGAGVGGHGDRRDHHDRHDAPLHCAMIRVLAG